MLGYQYFRNYRGKVVTKVSLDASSGANIPDTPTAGDIHRIDTAGTFDNHPEIRPLGFYFEPGDYMVRSSDNQYWDVFLGNGDVNDASYNENEWLADTLEAPSRRAIAEKFIDEKTNIDNQLEDRYTKAETLALIIALGG